MLYNKKKVGLELHPFLRPEQSVHKHSRVSFITLEYKWDLHK